MKRDGRRLCGEPGSAKGWRRGARLCPCLVSEGAARRRTRGQAPWHEIGRGSSVGKWVPQGPMYKASADRCPLNRVAAPTVRSNGRGGRRVQ